MLNLLSVGYGIRILADAFPSDPEVQIDLGPRLARLGRQPEAVQALDRGASLAPKDASLQRKRAAASMILRDYPRANAAYENAFEASQSDEDRFGKAAATWGTDVAKAQPLFEDLATPSPSAHPGLVDAARAWADAAAEGRSSPATVTLAERLVEEGQLILAIPLLDGVLAGDPGNAKARTMLADVFTRLESPRLATRAVGYPKLKFPAPLQAEIIETIFIASSIVTVSHPIKVEGLDPADNRILECAVDGKADYIISGDKHLLDLGSCGDIHDCEGNGVFGKRRVIGEVKFIVVQMLIHKLSFQFLDLLPLSLKQGGLLRWQRQ